MIEGTTRVNKEKGCIIVKFKDAKGKGKCYKTFKEQTHQCGGFRPPETTNRIEYY